MSFGIYAPPTLAQEVIDKIIVIGRREGVVCTGAACRSAIEDLVRQLGGGRLSPTPGEKPDPVEATTEQVCKAIKAKQPPDCTATPIIVGVNGGVANGCGTGSTSRTLGNVALYARHPFTYTGDIDIPYTNVSFKGACDAHDACFGRQDGLSTCNSAFQSAMNGACSRAAVPADCNSIAATYKFAVDNFGSSQYTDDGAKLACFKYQNDLKANGCT